MLNDEIVFKKFEQKMGFVRWALLFIALFSLDVSIYSNLRLFEKICTVLLGIGIWSATIYIIVQKIKGIYKYRHIVGVVETIGDLICLSSLAAVFGVEGNGIIYILHLIIVVVIYMRYMNSYIVWGMQCLVVVNMYIINKYMYIQYDPFKNMSFEVGLIAVIVMGILFQHIMKECSRLQMLVDVQSDNVKGLKRNIVEMNHLNEMSQNIFESQTKESIMRSLLENIQKAVGEDGISVFLYGENGVESDAKLYHYSGVRNYNGSEPMPYQVIYNQKQIESLREKREYRFCIQNYEPIVSTNTSYRELFEQLLGEGVKPYIYLFNMMNGDESVGIVICNLNRRLIIESCKNIDRMIEHVGIALFNTSMMEKERSKSIYDTLTGVKSRGSINETLPLMMKQVREEHVSLGVLFIDIDNFKKFNDTYGHSTGDIVLREVANTLKEYSPGDSLVGRYGGEEFLVVFYDVDEERAMGLAEYIRKKVSEIDLQMILRIDAQITISVGVALYPTHEQNIGLLVEYADAAMYEAKKTKNKVCIYHKHTDEEQKNEN